MKKRILFLSLAIFLACTSFQADAEGGVNDQRMPISDFDEYIKEWLQTVNSSIKSRGYKIVNESSFGYYSKSSYSFDGFNIHYSQFYNMPGEDGFDYVKSKQRASDQYQTYLQFPNLGQEVQEYEFENVDEYIIFLNGDNYHSVIKDGNNVYRANINVGNVDKMIAFQYIQEFIDLVHSDVRFVSSYDIVDVSMYSSLKGKILLKVEDDGKAYYVNPSNKNVYYLGRPADAFKVMREQGVGISNVNLNKIPIQFEGLGGSDNDLDGLHNFIEEAYGTDPNKKDSDGDGYDDGAEVKNGYNPNGSGKLNLDEDFSNQQKGKIFLQVEQDGEAWYVNPEDGKRYYLGRPADAFNVMRDLGLGISNDNFGKLVNVESDQSQESVNDMFAECEEYPDMLETCSAYECVFTHLLTGDKLKREVKGMVDGKCVYVEEMPNDGSLSCQYTDEMRIAVADEYRHYLSATSFGTEVSSNLNSGETEITYMIDGEQVSSPFQEALDNGQCVISGY